MTKTDIIFLVPETKDWWNAHIIDSRELQINMESQL